MRSLPLADPGTPPLTSPLAFLLWQARAQWGILLAAIAVGVIMVCGTFFWKLIRAMARIQMPERPGPRGAQR